MSALNFPTGASMCLVATTQAKTINLPTPDTGRLVYIVDSTGGANLNPITVSTSGSGVAICNGYSTIVQPFGTLGYLANNNNWYAIVNESGVDNWRTVIASNVSAAVVSTNYGFFSTISSGSVYGKHFGDGSLLTGLPAGGLTILPPVLSTTVMSSGILTGNLISTLNLSTTFGYISSLTVDSLSFGVANGFINMGDVITTSISSIQTFTSSLLTTNLQVGIVSSLSYIAFPGLQLGYNQSVIAEQSIGTGLQELLLFRGSTNTDRIRMQTTGTIVFEPGVSARVFPSASSNATPAMIITTGSNVGIGVLAPGVSLDVAGAGRFTALSVNTLSTNQVNSSNICNVGWLSNGGALSNLGGGAFFAGTSNTTTLGVAGTATLAGVTLTSLSNSGNFSNAGYISNSGALSNLGGTAYFAATSNTTTLGVAGIFTAASNITQTGGTTTLTGLSVNTISTNFISACNISSYSLSTTLGYFSTISSGAFYGKHIGDGSLLTGLPAAGITSIPQVLSTLAFYASSISTTTIQTSNILLGTVSSLSYLAFPGLQQQYAQSVLAEVSTGTGLQEMLLFRGSTATDRIRMQTTGSIIFETGVGARVFPAAPSNVTPAMIINTSSNVGIGIASPTVTLDVAGAGRFQTLSTQQIYASSFVGGVVSVATVYATTVSSMVGFFSTVNNYQIGGALYLPTQIFTF
jgi:hypothetical protein